VYGNETEVGEGIKEAIDAGIVKREDLFVTTKLWCTYHTRVDEGLNQSLSNLRLAYVDLYLMHWPVPMNPQGKNIHNKKLLLTNTKGNHPNLPTLPDGKRDLDNSLTFVDTWQNMENVYKASSDKVRAIGVANFSVPYLEKLLASANITPAANQIENHPYLPQQEIVDFCKSKKIHITAYSPLGSTGSPLFKEESIMSLAKEKGVSVGCILLSYHVARGNSVLAKSVTKSRIDENMKLIDLDDKDMEKLKKLTEGGKVTRFVYPAFGVNLGFADKQ